jgi:hypothetical protein
MQRSEFLQLFIRPFECHSGRILFRLSTVLEMKKDYHENSFCSRPSGSVPEGTTTKFIFITMGAQAGMDIPAE